MIFDFLIKKFLKPAPEAMLQWPIKAKTWAVGGGKGGVGKSFLASSMACALAQKGRKVILVDADLTGANIHTLFGIKVPGYTLNDYLQKKVKAMSGILLKTSLPNLQLICSASDIMELSNPGYAQKKRLIKGLSELEADFVIIDVGAGSSLNNLDFFNAADVGIIVTCPTPTAIQNAYSFLKMALHRRITGIFSGDMKLKVTALLEGDDKVRSIDGFIEALREIDDTAAERVLDTMSQNRYRLIVNMAGAEEGEKIAEAMAATCQKHLSIKLPSLGVIARSADIDASIRKMIPLMLQEKSDTSDAILRIVKNALEGTGTITVAQGENGEKKRVTIKTTDTCKLQTGLNEDIVHEGLTLHVQTEDLGVEKRKIQTLVYSGGRILFSKSTDYDEIKAPGDFHKAVMDKLLWQHAAIIAGIRAGKLKGKAGSVD